MELSKSKIKLVRSLEYKKFRDKNGLFIAEGKRLVDELLRSEWELDFLITHNEDLIIDLNLKSEKVCLADKKKINQLSSLTSPDDIIGVFKIKQYSIDYKELESNLSVVLDDIQNPGNLGTIIRLASWYGIKNIICSRNTVNIYNPKVIQASMGSISNVKVHYTDLNTFFDHVDNDLPIYGAFIEGNNIYKENLSEKGLIVLGNEGNGISAEIEKKVTNKINIPPHNTESGHVESLNVAMAGAIIISEFRRNQ